MGIHRLISQEDSDHSIIEIDPQQEVIRIFSSQGFHVGTISWDQLIHTIETSPSSTQQKSRKKARAALAMRVQYRKSHEKKVEGITGGISAGGLFIETRSPYPVHTELTVTFSLPTQPEAPITAHAIVTWTRGMTERFVRLPGMGIEFTKIDETARTELTKLTQSDREPAGEQLTSDMGSDTES